MPTHPNIITINFSEGSSFRRNCKTKLSGSNTSKPHPDMVIINNILSMDSVVAFLTI